MSNNKENVAALKIQYALKLNICNKKLYDFLKLKLNDLAQQNNFNNFRKIIIKKEIIDITKKFCNSLEIFKNGLQINPKFLITIYLIKYYSSEILGNDMNELDKQIFNISVIAINTLETKKIDNIWKVLYNFKIEFENWSKMDKNRTIEKLIISYYHHSQHINKIISNEISKDIEVDQKKDMIIELENQNNDILKTISIIDNKFDIEYLKKNYNYIYDNIQKSWEKIKNSITDNMIKAYYNTLCDDINNENLLILNVIKEIGNKLILLCPKNKIELFKNNFNDDNLINILTISDFSPELINFIEFIIELIILIDAPINDIINNKWKIEIKNLFNNYKINFPKILIQIEEHIDIIYKLLSKLK